jgi:glycosyltransferase involved in cell wall biosynthesis
MKILLLSRYGPLGSTSRVRFYQYLPYLARHGISVDVRPLLADAYVRNLYAGRSQSLIFLMRAYLGRLRALLQQRPYDLIWVEKEALPWLPAWIEMLFKGRTPWVVDYDDAAFHRYDQHRSVWVRRLLGKKIDVVMARADQVVAGNAYLARRAERAGAQQIARLPSVIDLDRYAEAASDSDTPFTIGWIGAPVTAPYLKRIAASLAKAGARAAQLHLIGSGPIELPGIPTEIIEWQEATETEAIARLDVGIMPLPDEPFERGKCGYKLIQYMACGLPVVASPVGVNSEIVRHGENGFLAEGAAEWDAALSQLQADPALRRRLGQAGRADIAATFTLEVNAPKLLAILQHSAGTMG